MEKESLEYKNQGRIDLLYSYHDESMLIPGDLNVELYASGSDDDSLSETSLLIEDGTKVLIKNKEISGGNELNLDSQSPTNYFEKSNEDIDEENIDENQDDWDQDYQEEQKYTCKTKTDSYLDLEENQDDNESNGSNEQDEDKESNNFSEEYTKIINPDPDKGIIEEEFGGTSYILHELINRKLPEEYMFDFNVHCCIAKDVSDQSMGIRAIKNPYMIIFTITKNLILTCEVYLEYYEKMFTEYIEDLLRVTHHIYFIGVTENNNKKFNEFWNDLSFNFRKNENKVNIESNFYFSNNKINLRSIIFIPNSPRGTLSYVFTKEILKITVPVNIL